MTDYEPIAWVDYTGTGARSPGRFSRLHRRDPYREGATLCGIDVPRFNRRPADQRVFEVVAAESTGRCLRCWVGTCRRCRQRPEVAVCCSAHGESMCHSCYRLTHHVELCDPACSDCTNEGLPWIYPPLPARRVVSTPDIATIGLP